MGGTREGTRTSGSWPLKRAAWSSDTGKRPPRGVAMLGEKFRRKQIGKILSLLGYGAKKSSGGIRAPS
jgi:hypothetical protein